ncbi:hypothetical protein KCP91_16660 [Microvirga sp. SRT01]|uniref:Lipoprotein n=1 Tax=Sphingomonas longa TaxID=2778730 RepID=A0ABS2DAQ7_9SPHN|nr:MULTISPECIES: hypothetical protein [Alphaproteobacteria]MBM6578017.1 hypothetical protein [Sphingomonas sp. BT552]MBR7711058.1 hypothetical protein [Microvirga sp. SRT01]
MPISSARIVPAAFLFLAACSSGDTFGNDTDATPRVTLRNLTAATSAPARGDDIGTLIPTPSDTQSRYFLLWQRKPLMAGKLVAVIRQERGGRVAYARVGVNCEGRLFHILGVGNRRSFAETAIAYDGPLRSIEGLPLREDLATYVCAAAGTPLAPRPAGVRPAPAPPRPRRS